MTAVEFYVKFGFSGYIKDGYGLRLGDPPEIIGAFYMGEDDKVITWLKDRGRYVYC